MPTQNRPKPIAKKPSTQPIQRKRRTRTPIVHKTVVEFKQLDLYRAIELLRQEVCTMREGNQSFYPVLDGLRQDVVTLMQVIKTLQEQIPDKNAP